MANGASWLDPFAWLNENSGRLNREMQAYSDNPDNAYYLANPNASSLPLYERSLFNMASQGLQYGQSYGDSAFDRFMATAKSGRMDLPSDYGGGVFSAQDNKNIGFTGFGGNPLRSDDEITSAYNQFAGTSGQDFTDAYTALMSERQANRQNANDSYQKWTLGGNYEGGILPDSGYKGAPSFSSPSFGSLASQSAFTTGAQPNSQPTGFGYPGSDAFQGWGGPQKSGGLGGLGGFSTWKNPFEPV